LGPQEAKDERHFYRYSYRSRSVGTSIKMKQKFFPHVSTLFVFFEWYRLRGVGVWGSRQRKIKAAYQFFLYTLLGSVFMLLAILFILLQTGTTDLQILLTTEFSERRQILLWIAFFASFAVKVPMVPFHIWLPEAHVEAPTAGSVILAGILLKLGAYGFLRFSIPMFPEATVFFTPFIYTLSVIGIIYTSLTTLRQIDLKKIIAYSSVAHMNLVTIGMFSRAAAVRSPIWSYGHTSKANR